MTPFEFETFIDRYGGDLKRWPEALQAGAAALLQSSGAARQALSAMQEVEVFLASSALRSVDHDALAARASRSPQVRPIKRFVMKTGWSAAAVALLAVGILVGRINGITQDDEPSATLATALASTEIINVE